MNGDAATNSALIPALVTTSRCISAIPALLNTTASMISFQNLAVVLLRVADTEHECEQLTDCVRVVTENLGELREWWRAVVCCERKNSPMPGDSLLENWLSQVSPPPLLGVSTVREHCKSTHLLMVDCWSLFSIAHRDKDCCAGHFGQLILTGGVSPQRRCSDGAICQSCRVVR